MASQNQFEAFLHDVEPSPTTKSDASYGHTVLRKYLNGHATFRSLIVNDYLSGSYKRDTAIRPRIKEGVLARPDVDIIVVTNHTWFDSPEDVIATLFDTLEPEYGPNIRRQRRSVKVWTDKVDIDVVPIIAPYGPEDTLYIPDRELEHWIVTNPPGHTTWTTTVNKKANGRFKPLVKLMKWWRRSNPTIARKPKGFVLECLAAESMDYGESHYGRLFLSVLDGIVSRYGWYADQGILPFVADPGVPGNNVLSGMTTAAFQAFVKKVRVHANLTRKALAERDPEVADSLWRDLFDRFPRTKHLDSDLLTAATSVPVLGFPDRPVIPSRPAGFA